MPITQVIFGYFGFLVGYGVFDGTLGFVRVGAVGKTAKTDVGANVAIQGGHLLRDDVPELKLADARGVDDVAAKTERPESGGGGRVTALLGIGTDRANANVQVVIDGV